MNTSSSETLAEDSKKEKLEKQSPTTQTTELNLV